MLTTDELLNLTRIPKISEISLKLLQEFYDIHICPNIYIFELEDRNIIKLEFLDVNLCHLLGFQHIVPYKLDKFYGGENGYLGIYNEQITIKKLRSINEQKFARDKDKILCFSSLYQLLRQSKIIKFDRNKIHSKISCEFILYDSKFERRIHLGIEKDEKRGVYYPRTFFIERENGERFVLNQESLKIIKRKIVSKYPFKSDLEIVAAVSDKRRGKNNKVNKRRQNRQNI